MHAPRFGLFPFRSPLLRESLSISFPPGTEMFHFPGFATQYALPILLIGGLPHSDISGSKHASCSPKRFVGSYVLRRLLVPRHPPCALTIFFSMARTYLHSGGLPPVRSDAIFIEENRFCHAMQLSRYDEGEPSRPDTERSRAAKADISGN